MSLDNYTDAELKPGHTRLLKTATRAAIGVSISLAFIKFYGWLETDAISILGSLLDSLMDITSALMIAFAVKYSLQPADHDHRFGHGKAEPVAALVQAIFIAASAVILLIESCLRILYPGDVIRAEETGLAIMGFSFLMSLSLYLFQRFVFKRTGSMAVEANAANYRMDVLVNFITFLAIGVVYISDMRSVDALAGAGIALYLIVTAYGIAKGALDVLMDKELPEKDREKITKIALSHPQVYRVENLRTRTSSSKIFVEFTLQMSGILTLEQAKDIADIISFKIQKSFPDAEVVIQKSPWGERDPVPRMPNVRPIRDKNKKA